MLTSNTSNGLKLRVPQLDGIRGIAIVLVLVWHYVVGQVQVPAGSLAAYCLKSLSMTWAGVDVFFALSGFLIGGILLENQNSPRYYLAFYVRRLCRISPLYYFMLSLFTIAVLLKWYGDGARNWLFAEACPLWTYGVYLQNFAIASRGEMQANWMAITWSLAVEEQFYLILPLIIRLSPPSAMPAILITLILLSPVVRVLLYIFYGNGGLAGYVLLPARWDAMFLGVLGAWLVRHRKYGALLKKATPLLIVLVSGGLAFIFALLLAKQGIGSRGMSYGGYTVIGTTSICMILIAVTDDRSLISQFFVSRPLIWLGTISYGVYLFHQPVAGIVHYLIKQQAPRITSSSDLFLTLIALCITLGLAELSWRYFERPLVQYGQRVKY